MSAAKLVARRGQLCAVTLPHLVIDWRDIDWGEAAFAVFVVTGVASVTGMIGGLLADVIKETSWSFPVGAAIGALIGGPLAAKKLYLDE